jgi:hypothetical protein
LSQRSFFFLKKKKRKMQFSSLQLLTTILPVLGLALAQQHNPQLYMRSAEDAHALYARAASAEANALAEASFWNTLKHDAGKVAHSKALGTAVKVGKGIGKGLGKAAPYIEDAAQIAGMFARSAEADAEAEAEFEDWAY